MDTIEAVHRMLEILNEHDNHFITFNFIMSLVIWTIFTGAAVFLFDRGNFWCSLMTFIFGKAILFFGLKIF